MSKEKKAKVYCPGCNAAFGIPRKLLGKSTKCTKCGISFVLEETQADFDFSEPEPQVPIEKSSGSPDTTGELELEPPISQPYPPVSPPPVTEAERIERQPRHIQTHLTRDSVDRPKFMALRIVASIYEVCAVLFGILYIVGLAIYVSQGITKIRLSDSAVVMTTVVIELLGAIIGGLLIITFLLFIAQCIRLGLQIEENTYETRIACLTQLEESKRIFPD